MMTIRLVKDWGMNEWMLRMVGTSGRTVGMIGMMIVDDDDSG